MSVLIAVSLAVFTASGPTAAEQTPARVSACALLTRELVTKVTTPKMTVKAKPSETPVGARGSNCDYGGVILQVDPFAGADKMRSSPQKTWVAVSGVGETAYFNTAYNAFAEIIVWSGTHHFGIYMDVPPGATAEQLKPNLIQLANLIIPKLK